MNQQYNAHFDSKQHTLKAYSFTMRLIQKKVFPNKNFYQPDSARRKFGEKRLELVERKAERNVTQTEK